MNFNQILKERREKPFARNYPCQCKMQCERFNGELQCDNCAYCGTDGIGSEREPMRYPEHSYQINLKGIF